MNNIKVNEIVIVAKTTQSWQSMLKSKKWRVDAIVNNKTAVLVPLEGGKSAYFVPMKTLEVERSNL